MRTPRLLGAVIALVVAVMSLGFSPAVAAAQEDDGLRVPEFVPDAATDLEATRSDGRPVTVSPLEIDDAAEVVDGDDDVYPGSL